MLKDSTGSGLPEEPHSSGTSHLLDALVGTWTMEIAHPLATGGTIHGRATFEWLGNRGFLIHRWQVEHPDFPAGIAIIGPDESGEAFEMRYFDSRGVHRVYTMSLRDGVWTISRTSPGFWQRFTGVFSPDGQTITGRWAKSPDGVAWEPDFDVTYRTVV